MQAFFLNFVVADNILPSTSTNCLHSEPASSQALKFQKTAKNKSASENYLLFNKLTTADQKRIYSTLSTELRAGLWDHAAEQTTVLQALGAVVFYGLTMQWYVLS